MSALDLGPPAAEAGTCPLCGLGDRPLWRRDDRLTCGACATRLYPGVSLTFRSPTGPVVARQEPLPGLAAARSWSEGRPPRRRAVPGSRRPERRARR